MHTGMKGHEELGEARCPNDFSMSRKARKLEWSAERCQVLEGTWSHPTAKGRGWADGQRWWDQILILGKMLWNRAGMDWSKVNFHSFNSINICWDYQYLFPIAPIRNYHKLSGLKLYRFLILQFWMSEIWSRLKSGLKYLKPRWRQGVLEENPFPCLSSV